MSISITAAERLDLYWGLHGPQIDYTVTTDLGACAFVRSDQPLSPGEVCDRAWGLGLRWPRRGVPLWFWAE